MEARAASPTAPHATKPPRAAARAALVARDAGLQPLLPVLIVHGALVLVRQGFVRLADLLEAFF